MLQRPEKKFDYPEKRLESKYLNVGFQDSL